MCGAQTALAECRMPTGVAEIHAEKEQVMNCKKKWLPIQTSIIEYLNILLKDD